MTKIILILSFLTYQLSAYSSNVSKNMTAIYKNMLQLQKSLPLENCGKAEGAFKTINSKMEPLGKHLFQANQGYSVAFKNFQRNLNAIEESCKMTNADLSYRESIFQGLVKSCFHCHSTDRLSRDLPPFPINADIKDKISMFMMSRNYNQAESQIDIFFKNIDYKIIKDIFELERDLYLKIHNEPAKLVSRYNSRAKSGLQEPWNWKLKTWLFELENLPKYNKPEALFEDANSFIEKRIGLFVSESERIRLKYLLGRLHHYLHDAEKNDIPKVLYYLGSLENRLEHNFYSVDNLYLMECLDKYGKSPFGKKCYDEFMSQVNFSFTGSSGTKIPEGIKKLIKELTPTP